MLTRKVKGAKPNPAKKREWILATCAFLLYFVPLIWLFRAKELWSWQTGAWISPRHIDVFEKLSGLLGHHRIVLPTELLSPSLLFLSFSGLIALTFIAQQLTKIIPTPPAYRIAGALLLVAIIFNWARPGEDPSAIVALLYQIFLLGIVVQDKPSAFAMSIATVVGLFVSYVSQEFALVFLWTGLVFIFSESFHFIFVRLASTSRAERFHPIQQSLQMFSYCAIAAAFLIAATSFDINLEAFVPSTRLWILPITSGLAIMASYLYPWRTLLWLRLGSLPFALFLTADAELWSAMIAAWLFLEIGKGILATKTTIKIPIWVHAASLSLMVLFSGISIAMDLQKSVPTRTFAPEWAASAEVINSNIKDNKGVLLLGNSLPFLSFFSKAPLVENLPVHLEASEVELAKILEKENIQAIIVEKDYLRRFWAHRIQAGGNPDQINYSVFSRLILNDGKEVKTSTLKLPETKIFEIKDLKMNGLVWIEKKS